MNGLPNPSRHFVIEFFGMPGSGKTTVASEVIDALRTRGMTVSDGSEITHNNLPKATRIRTRLAMIVRELPTIRRVFPTLFSVLSWQQPSQRDRLKSILVCATVSSMLARLGRRGENAVLDQGLAQAAWSAMLKSEDRRSAHILLSPLRSLVPRHEWHVVILDAPDETIRQRLDARESKHSRMQSQTASEETVLWARARDIFEEIAAEMGAAADRGETTLTRLSSHNTDPSLVAQAVVKSIF